MLDWGNFPLKVEVFGSLSQQHNHKGGLMSRNVVFLMPPRQLRGCTQGIMLGMLCDSIAAWSILSMRRKFRGVTIQRDRLSAAPSLFIQSALTHSFSSETGRHHCYCSNRTCICPHVDSIFILFSNRKEKFCTYFI